MELKRQFEALSGRYGDLEGALTAEKVARGNVEQCLAQEAKALQLGEEVTELRNSQQRFDISTRRASLVVHNVPESPGVNAKGMPCSRSATVRASSHSHTARLSDWASHQQMLGLASRPGQGLCLSNLGLLSRSTSSCSSLRLSATRRSTLMMISPHTSVTCVQSSAACSACSSSTRGLVSGGRSAFSPCMSGGWCYVIGALCLQAVAVLQRRREYSAQDWCRGQTQLRGSICLLQTSLLHLMPD